MLVTNLMMIGSGCRHYFLVKETKEGSEERHLVELHNHEVTTREYRQYVVLFFCSFTLLSSSSVATASKTCLGIIRVRRLSRAALPLNSSTSAVHKNHVIS